MPVRIERFILGMLTYRFSKHGQKVGMQRIVRVQISDPFVLRKFKSNVSANTHALIGRPPDISYFTRIDFCLKSFAY